MATTKRNGGNGSRDKARSPTRRAPSTRPSAPSKVKARAARVEKKERKQEAGGLLSAPTFHEVDRSLKIRVLRDDNPRRPGSETFDHWKRYVKDGITVEEFFARGGTWLHLRADIMRGHVKLVK